MTHHPDSTSAARRKASVVVASVVLGALGVMTLAWAASVNVVAGSLSVKVQDLGMFVGPTGTAPSGCHATWSSDYRTFVGWYDDVSPTDECTTTTTSTTTTSTTTTSTTTTTVPDTAP